MPHGKEVVSALRGLREAGHAFARPEFREEGEPAGEEFVWIALVPDIKQQPIVPEIKNIVERDREFDDAQIRRQMPAGLGNLIVDRRPNLAREIVQTIDREPFEVGG